MKNSTLFVRSALAAVALLALALFDSTPVLALPSQCKPNPGGTQDCTSLVPTPYTYLNAACSTPSLLWPSEGQALAAHFGEFGPGNCPAPTRIGWIPKSAPRCMNGPCVLGSDYIGIACGGYPYPAPGYSGDLEVMNWLLYEYSGTSTQADARLRRN